METDRKQTLKNCKSITGYVLSKYPYLRKKENTDILIKVVRSLGFHKFSAESITRSRRWWQNTQGMYKSDEQALDLEKEYVEVFVYG